MVLAMLACSAAWLEHPTSEQGHEGGTTILSASWLILLFLTMLGSRGTVEFLFLTKGNEHPSGPHQRSAGINQGL